MIGRREVFGALGAVAVCCLLGLSTGGFPAYPSFQGIGIGVAAKGTTNKLWIENAGTVSAVVSNSTLSTGFAQTVVQTNNGTGGGAQAILCINAAASSCSPNEGQNHAVLLNSGPLHLLSWSGTDSNDDFALGMAGANAAERARLMTNGSTNASTGYIGIYDSSGTRYGYFGKANAGSGPISYESDAAAQLVGNNGTDTLLIDTSHHLGYNGVGITPSSGTFTATGTGGTGGTTSGTATYDVIGSFACTNFPAINFTTSNATTFTFTGMPAAIQPASIANQNIAISGVQDNGSSAGNFNALVQSGSGTITFYKGNSATGWTASGVKGFILGPTLCWVLN